MANLWQWLLYVLAAWSHDPVNLELDRARTAGAVAVAYAALAVEHKPSPKREEQPEPPSPAVVPETPPSAPPKPPEVKPCPLCNDTGRIYRDDGGYVRCQCRCRTGKCRAGS